MIGLQFERLTVIGRGEQLRGKPGWLCVCECGQKKVATASHLRLGMVKSCGCLRRDFGKAKRKDIAERRFGMLVAKECVGTVKYGRPRWRCECDCGNIAFAKKRGYSWSFTKQQFRKLSKSNCRYCGVEPFQVMNGQTHNGSFTYNGVDRIDNTHGYHADNVAPCCGTCNIAKGTMSVEQFSEWVIRVCKYFAEDQRTHSTKVVD